VQIQNGKNNAKKAHKILGMVERNFVDRYKETIIWHNTKALLAVMGKILWTTYLKYFTKYYTLKCIYNDILKYFMVNVFKILCLKRMLYFLYFNNKIQYKQLCTTTTIDLCNAKSQCHT